MSNKDNVDLLQLQGTQRETAIEAFEKQLNEWGLTLPKEKPLVLEFGFGNFDKVGLIETWIANEKDHGYCGKYMFVFANQQCPYHSHQQKHETFCVIKGRMKMAIGREICEMESGNVLPVPPGEIHSFTGIENTLFLELSTPCLIKDNKFEEPKITAWLEGCIS